MVDVRYSRVEGYRVAPGWHGRKPYVPVRLRNGGRAIETFGIVDSGADSSLFHRDWATPLGLVIDPTRPALTTGIGGDAQVWYFDIALSVFGKSFTASVGFSDSVPKPFGLLGRADFFAAFSVGFDQSNEQLLLNAIR